VIELVLFFALPIVLVTQLITFLISIRFEDENDFILVGGHVGLLALIAITLTYFPPTLLDEPYRNAIEEHAAGILLHGYIAYVAMVLVAMVIFALKSDVPETRETNISKPAQSTYVGPLTALSKAELSIENARNEKTHAKLRRRIPASRPTHQE